LGIWRVEENIPFVVSDYKVMLLPALGGLPEGRQKILKQYRRD
jgi:hypothetical protein